MAVQIKGCRLVSNRQAVLRATAEQKRRALEIVGGMAETYAKALCPTKTGNLKNSITHQQQDENTEVIGTTVKYAPYVEFGHHQEPGRYVPAIGKRLKVSWVNPIPFITPAVQNHMDEYKHVIEQELAKI